MMRSIIIAGTLAISSAALADDKPKGGFTGCYGEAGVGLQSSVHDNHIQRDVKQLSIGAGCNASLGVVIIGGGARVNAGSGSREVEPNIHLGVKVNDGVMAYALGSYAFDAKSHAIDTKTGVLAAGVGAEIVITRNVNAYIEAARDLAKVGLARELSEQTTVRVGTRARF